MADDLESVVQIVPLEIHGTDGSRMFMIQRIQIVPSWITHKVLMEEHDNNWDATYQEF